MIRTRPTNWRGSTRPPSVPSATNPFPLAQHLAQEYLRDYPRNAHQAEYLCRSAEAYTLIKGPKVKGKAAIPRDNRPLTSPTEVNDTSGRSTSTIEAHLEEIFGVKVTRRTLIYFGKRLGELNIDKTESKTLQQLFKKNRLLEFKAIFQEIMSTSPFQNEKEHNIDAINALNFAIFYQLEGKRVAQEGLRFVLRWRKNR